MRASTHAKLQDCFNFTIIILIISYLAFIILEYIRPYFVSQHFSPSIFLYFVGVMLLGTFTIGKHRSEWGVESKLLYWIIAPLGMMALYLQLSTISAQALLPGLILGGLCSLFLSQYVDQKFH